MKLHRETKTSCLRPSWPQVGGVVLQPDQVGGVILSPAGAAARPTCPTALQTPALAVERVLRTAGCYGSDRQHVSELGSCSDERRFWHFLLFFFHVILYGLERALRSVMQHVSCLLFYKSFILHGANRTNRALTAQGHRLAALSSYCGVTSTSQRRFLGSTSRCRRGEPAV